MTLQELYQAKGELTMTIEVAQAKLQNVNRQLIDILNGSPSSVVLKDAEVLSKDVPQG